jgi:hypothetical protein
MSCFSFYLFCFFFNKIREQEGGTGFCPEWSGAGRGDVAQIKYTHVDTCKNDKIKIF